MSRNGFSRIGYPLLAASLVFGAAAMAQNQPAPGTLPDAQIEANVLRALASAPELSTQNIQSSTVYGTVTLTGNVHDETMRTQAENLVARAVGVKKVVDELSLGDTAASSDQAPTARSKCLTAAELRAAVRWLLRARFPALPAGRKHTASNTQSGPA